MKKLLLLLTLSILSIPIFLSGCSNKPNLKQWSKGTALYLLSKADPGYKVQLLKCQSMKVFGSSVAQCSFNLKKIGFKAKKKKDIENLPYYATFTQSVNGNWEINGNFTGGPITIIKPPTD